MAAVGVGAVGEVAGGEGDERAARHWAGARQHFERGGRVIVDEVGPRGVELLAVEREEHGQGAAVGVRISLEPQPPHPPPPRRRRLRREVGGRSFVRARYGEIGGGGGDGGGGVVRGSHACRITPQIHTVVTASLRRYGCGRR